MLGIAGVIRSVINNSRQLAVKHRYVSLDEITYIASYVATHLEAVTYRGLWFLLAIIYIVCLLPQIPSVKEQILERKINLKRYRGHLRDTGLNISAIQRYAKDAACEENMDPVKYSTSKAAQWTAIETRAGPAASNDWPWYQNYVISGCLSVFLVYFCILREENDIDQKLSTPLYDRIEGLEEKMIEQRIQYNEEHGIDSSDLRDRLQILQQESIRLRKL